MEIEREDVPALDRRRQRQKLRKRRQASRQERELTPALAKNSQKSVPWCVYYTKALKGMLCLKVCLNRHLDQVVVASHRLGRLSFPVPPATPILQPF